LKLIKDTNSLGGRGDRLPRLASFYRSGQNDTQKDHVIDGEKDTRLEISVSGLNDETLQGLSRQKNAMR
jgi:hypothetical protein